MKKIIIILIATILQVSCSYKPIPIQEAIANNNLEAVKKFLGDGNNINEVYNGYPLLAYAIKKNSDQELIEYLIDEGADVNYFNNGRKSPLMYAAKYSRNELISFLISNGAKVNLQNEKGTNALFYAIKYENAEGLKKLIELGGDMNLKLDGKHSLYDMVKELNSNAILAALNMKYTPKLGIDGPYIFYENKNKVSLTVKEEKDSLTIKKQKLDSTSISIKVTVDSDQKEQFTITLQDSLEIPKTTYSEPEKLIAISDIEGNFYALKKILLGSGVMDASYNWIYGNGHVVLVGDFFDRGINVTQSLWLLYELERQAKKQEGVVHFIIGNHEIMNLQGDNRYTKTKYKDLAISLDMKTQELYSEHTELGRWLRTKNCVEKIGNTLYTHGGISKEVVNHKLDLEKINDLGRMYYGKSDQEILRNNEAKLIFSTNKGPLWYRGYFKDEVNQSEIDEITQFYNIDHIVVGHTPTKSIKRLFNDKVIAIDLKHPNKPEKGKVKGLLKQLKEFYIIDESGTIEKLL